MTALAHDLQLTGHATCMYCALLLHSPEVAHAQQCSDWSLQFGSVALVEALAPPIPAPVPDTDTLLGSGDLLLSKIELELDMVLIASLSCLDQSLQIADRDVRTRALLCEREALILDVLEVLVFVIQFVRQLFLIGHDI